MRAQQNSIFDDFENFGFLTKFGFWVFWVVTGDSGILEMSVFLVFSRFQNFDFFWFFGRSENLFFAKNLVFECFGRGDKIIQPLTGVRERKIDFASRVPPRPTSMPGLLGARQELSIRGRIIQIGEILKFLKKSSKK